MSAQEPTTRNRALPLLSLLALFCVSLPVHAMDVTPIYNLYGEEDHEMSPDIQNWEVRDYWLFYDTAAAAPGSATEIFHCSRYIWFWGTEHFVSKSSGCDGHTTVESLGYLSNSNPGDGYHVQLRECQNGKDHFTTTDPNCEGHSYRETLGWASVRFDRGVTKAQKTTYPVVFIHGLGGKMENFADSDGTSIDDQNCDPLCNPYIRSDQKLLVPTINAANDSEQRGDELFNAILAYMNSPASGYAQKVNIVGHSQGGIDMRKAAHRLKAMSINGSPAGEDKVAVMISLQSPHRGTPIAKKTLDTYFWTTGTAESLFCKVTGVCPDFFGDVIADFGDAFLDYAPLYGEDKDLTNVLMQLSYDDYDSGDGIITGMKHFNNLYPADPVAGYVASIVAGQDDQASRGDVIKAMHAVLGFNHSFDGDGYCQDDCDNDGAAGQGDGYANDQDDDGLVPLNSMQIGKRLQYVVNSCAEPCFDTVNSFVETTVSYVSDINNPPADAMTSHAGRVYADHFDVINSSFNPADNGFDESEFYAAMVDFIADKEATLAATSPDSVFGNVTAVNDDGNGNLVFLDRHNVNCNGGAGIAQFRLDRPTFGKMAYRYTCQNYGDVNGSVYFTGNNNDGNGNVIFLDRHGVDCWGRAVQKFHLQRPNSSEITYRYRCGNQSLVNISDHYTTADSDGNGDALFLDRHDVSCPTGKMLTYFRLQRPSSSTIRYHYKCGE